MLATLASKGQLTLPNGIRDRLGLSAGSTLGFELMADDMTIVRANALRLRGLLKSPHAASLSVEDMDASVDAQQRGRHAKAKRCSGLPPMCRCACG